MTEAKDADPTRVALIRKRFGELLIEEEGASATYATPMGDVRKEQWWGKTKPSDECESIVNHQLLAHLTKYWPVQPRATELGRFYSIATTTLDVSKRDAERRLWEGKTPDSKAYLENLAKQTAQTVEYYKRFAVAFDDRKVVKAAALIQEGLAKFRRASELLDAHAEEQLQYHRLVFRSDLVDEKSILHPSRLLRAVVTFVEARLPASLRNKTPWGLEIPQSKGAWKEFETRAAQRLIELGVDQKRVIQLFSSDAEDADPEDERTRISRNLRRAENP